MSSTLLYNRDVSLQAGPLVITSRFVSGEVKPTLRIRFRTERDLTDIANKAEITLYNLTKETRAGITKESRLELLAGYTSNTNVGLLGQLRFVGSTLALIFSGDIARVTHTSDSVNWITKVQAGDGEKNLQLSTINVAFEKDSKAQDILTTLVDNLGLNSERAKLQLNKELATRNLEFTGKGISLSGNTARLLKQQLKSYGLSFSVQNENLEIKRPEEPIGKFSVTLSASTGMIGSPQTGEDGVVKIKSLLQPNLSPGNPIKIQSELVPPGFYQILKIIHTGDTWGKEWYSDIECKAIT